MEDVSVLEAASREVAYRGETLRVTPLKVGQIPRFLRIVRPMFGALGGAALSPGSAAGGVELDIMQLVADHGEALIEAVAVATGKPADWVGQGEADEFAHLVKAVLEVNADFFAKKVAPLLNPPEAPAALSANSITTWPCTPLACATVGYTGATARNARGAATTAAAASVVAANATGAIGASCRCRSAVSSATATTRIVRTGAIAPSTTRGMSTATRGVGRACSRGRDAAGDSHAGGATASPRICCRIAALLADTSAAVRCCHAALCAHMAPSATSTTAVNSISAWPSRRCCQPRGRRSG